MYMIIARLTPPVPPAATPAGGQVLAYLMLRDARPAGIKLEHVRVHSTGSSFSVALFIMAETLPLAELDAISLIHRTLKVFRRSMG